jgi:hypothetical protein
VYYNQMTQGIIDVSHQLHAYGAGDLELQKFDPKCVPQDLADHIHLLSTIIPLSFVLNSQEAVYVFAIRHCQHKPD